MDFYEFEKVKSEVFWAQHNFLEIKDVLDDFHEFRNYVEFKKIRFRDFRNPDLTGF